MAATMRLPQNMGRTDRIVRGALGSAMLLHGLMKPEKSAWSKAEMAIGGAFLAYGLSGFDPLLVAMKTSTRPEDSDNLLNRLVRRQFPGQGFHPKASEQPVPKRAMRNGGLQRTVADQLAVR